MTGKDLAAANERFYQFLQKQGPSKETDCTVYMDKSGNYYLVICRFTGNGKVVYLINERFWYDYTEIFIETGEWTVIYQKHM